MNKYKVKIVAENGKYVGYALLNDEPVFQTGPCSSSTTASKRLEEIIEKHKNQTQPQEKIIPFVPVVQKTVIKRVPPMMPPSPPVAPRRCCGRG